MSNWTINLSSVLIKTVIADKLPWSPLPPPCNLLVKNQIQIFKLSSINPSYLYSEVGLQDSFFYQKERKK